MRRMFPAVGDLGRATARVRAIKKAGVSSVRRYVTWLADLEWDVKPRYMANRRLVTAYFDHCEYEQGRSTGRPEPPREFLRMRAARVGNEILYRVFRHGR